MWLSKYHRLVIWFISMLSGAIVGLSITELDANAVTYSWRISTPELVKVSQVNSPLKNYTISEAAANF